MTRGDGASIAWNFVERRDENSKGNLISSFWNCLKNLSREIPRDLQRTPKSAPPSSQTDQKLSEIVPFQQSEASFWSCLKNLAPGSSTEPQRNPKSSPINQGDQKLSEITPFEQSEASLWSCLKTFAQGSPREPQRIPKRTSSAKRTKSCPQSFLLGNPTRHSGAA